MFPVLNNFSDTQCMKVGLDTMISLVRVLSTGGREASSQISHLSPPVSVKYASLIVSCHWINVFITS